MNAPAASDTKQSKGYATQQTHYQTTIWQAIKGSPHNFAWCLFGIFALATVSFDQNAAGIVLGIPAFRRDFGTAYAGDYVIDSKWQAIFGGAPLAAAAVGAIMAGVLGDIIGRRWTICIGLAFTLVGAGVEVASTTVQTFFAGKFVAGIALGMLLSTVVTWNSEIAPLALRGLITALAGFSFGLGSLICYAVLLKVGARTDRWAYRAIFVTQFGFGGISLLIAPFMPESPVWLLNRGNDEAALKSLQKLGHSDTSAADHLAQMKVMKIAADAQTASSSWFELFRGTNLRRTMVCVMGVVIQGFIGLVFITGYFTYYCQLSGIATSDSFKYSLAFGLLGLIGNVVGSLLVDKIGRRPNTIYGVAACAVILWIAGGLGLNTTNPAAIKGTVAMMLLWQFVASAFFITALFAYVPETPTNKLRIKTAAVVLTTQGAFNTMWAFILPYIFNPNAANLGSKTFFIFAALSTASVVYLWFAQTETSKRSFEEIDELFHKKVPARHFKKFVTDAEIKTRGTSVQQTETWTEDKSGNVNVHVECA